MINFFIKFFNISTIIFVFNILIFNILINFFPLHLALICTLSIIFILNFLFIIYAFDIKKNREYFLLGLIFLSLTFRILEYFLFQQILFYFESPTLGWVITISVTFFLKIIFYKFYFDLKIFKNKNTKKKILIFSPDIKNGGAEKNISILLDSLDTKKFEISLILWKNSLVQNKKIKKIVIKKSRIRNSFFIILFIIIKKNPDYIFSSLNHLNIFLGLIRIISGSKSKQIIRESNYLSYKLKDEYKNNQLKILIRKFLTFITYNYSDKIICPSREINHDLIKNFKIKKSILRLIPNLFDGKKISRQRDFKFTKKSLISIGRLELQKDYQFMLKAFKESLKFKDNTLLIIGNGSEKKNLTQLINKLSLQSKVKIIKFQNDIYNFLFNSKALLMTSKYEGMPNIVLESCHLGIKCLLTDFPGSSFFKKYNNVKISKKEISLYSKEIVKLDEKRVFSKSFNEDFLKKDSKKIFLDCFN